MTLLEMTQNILSDMNSDDVSSISETVESLQVAEIIKTKYYDLVATMVIPEHRTLIRLTALSDVSHPNYVKMEDDVKKIHYLSYDKRGSSTSKPNHSEIKYMEPTEFIRMIMLRNPDSTGVDVITDFSGVETYIETDKQPTYFTSFDDQYLVFDSYDSDIDSTLQASKCIAYGEVEPSFTMSDTFTPDLDSDLFPLLLSESKAYAFYTLKQMPNEKLERDVRNHKVRMQKNKQRVGAVDYYPNYGKK